MVLKNKQEETIISREEKGFFGDNVHKEEKKKSWMNKLLLEDSFNKNFCLIEEFWLSIACGTVLHHDKKDIGLSLLFYLKFRWENTSSFELTKLGYIWKSSLWKMKIDCNMLWSWISMMVNHSTCSILFRLTCSSSNYISLLVKFSGYMSEFYLIKAHC